MRLVGDWLRHPGTRALFAAFAEAGHQALFVGGCVRNAVLGLPVADIDLATDAMPADVTRIGNAAGFKVVPTGIDHGTVTVIAEGRPHEVTTFRRDLQTDGRRAVVAFATSIERDAARRDLTMNALYADAEGLVIDPLGVLGDALARRVRFVGDPGTRIREDRLRILRFFRFHACYGDQARGIDPDGLAACADFAAGLETISRERIGAEMRKLLAAEDPAPTVATMREAGVLCQVLPGADTGALAPLVHLEAARAPRWQRRLAVLGGLSPERLLRLSRQDANILAALHGAIASPLGPAALGWIHGAAVGADAVLARAAVMGQALPANWEADLARGAAAELPVTAADLMPCHSGAALGARLKALEQAWLASDLRLDRAALLAR